MKKWLKGIAVIAGAAMSGVLYRMGGSDTYNTKWRDCGVATVTTLLIGIWFGWAWPLILCWGALFGALTTYLAGINKWFGLPKEKKYWFNWLLVGLICGLEAAPVLISHIWLWPGVLLRSAVMAILVMVWSELNSNAVWEEVGRGAIIALTVPLIGWLP